MFPSGMKVFLNRAHSPISCCVATWEGGRSVEEGSVWGNPLLPEVLESPA